MYYQIANTAPPSTIESTLQASFKYKELYTARKLINGLDESTLEVVTPAHPNQISLAIWGILPIHYEGDWEDFQQLTNTLTIGVDQWKDNRWYSNPETYHRCIIVSTGFYTHAIHQGKVYRYFVRHAVDDLLLFGGIYNQLDDGFLTCAILTKKSKSMQRKVKSSVDSMPLIVSKKNKTAWLDPQTSPKAVDELLMASEMAPLSITPVDRSRSYDFSGKKEA